jgi:hypothetical protein
MVLMAFCPTGLLGLIDRAAKAAARRLPSAPVLRPEGTGP